MAEPEKPHPTAGEDGQPTQAFVDDPHISFDKESGKWRYEADDGKEFEYDMTARAWAPLVRLRASILCLIHRGLTWNFCCVALPYNRSMRNLSKRSKLRMPCPALTKK